MSAFDPDVMESTALAIRRPVLWLSSWFTQCPLWFTQCPSWFTQCPSWFTAHPSERGLTYGQHLRRAWYMAWRMLYGSACLFVHGVFPAWFSTAGSKTIKQLYLDVRGAEEKEREKEV